MPVGVQVAHVDLSILSGSVRIYAAKNRKPSPASFDYTSAFTGELDFLSIVRHSFIIRAYRRGE